MKWETRALGDVVTLINGRAYSQHELLEKGTPVIRIQNLNGGNRWYYSNLDLPEDKYCDDGDLLFAWSASFGPYLWQGPKAIYHYHIWKIVPGEHTDRGFMYFLLQWITESIRAASHGIGMLHMTKEGMEKWPVALPPLSEQKRIAARLREQLAEVEKAREALQSQLEAAEKLPSALLGQRFDGKTAQGWPRRKLGDVLRLRKDIIHPRNQPKGATIFVGLEHVESLTGRRIGGLPVDMAALTGRKPRFYPGDVVYGYLRPYLNKVWLADREGLCSVDQYVYSVDDSLADAAFVTWFMRSPVYQSRAPVSVMQSQLPRIRTDQVAAVEINLPGLKEQRSFARAVENEISEAVEIATKLRARLEAVEKLPAALLREVFESRVSDD